MEERYCNICGEYHNAEKAESHENAALKAEEKYSISI